MPIYSFGKDSPLKFELSREYAALFNRAYEAFFVAQKNHLERTGSEWTPDQPLWIEWTEEEKDAFNQFKHIFEEALERLGRPVSEDEILDDYLIEN